MNIKPILFNTEMVKAILDGRKTVTRRLVKLPRYIEKQENGLYTMLVEDGCYEDQCMDEVIPFIRKPYEVGDILYVRETWLIADGCAGEKYFYKTDETEVSKEARLSYGYKWRPSLHMSKEAARIFLKVTDVRVERMGDMTVEDMIKEGINTDEIITTDGPIKYRVINRFEELWDSTVKEDWQKYVSNPWVWVIEFERCEKPKGWC